MIIEAIASTPDDCVRIETANCDRIELCSALVLGGLTPSVGTLVEAKKRTTLPIVAMVRPRAAGMAYSEYEFSSMLYDVEAFREAGADGVVFGVLNESGTLDQKRMAELAEAAGDMEKVCHRAFDLTPDPFEALEQLISLGMTRVLTSGQQPSVGEGMDVIAKVVDKAADRIQVMPGAGFDAYNVARIVSTTKCNQVHLACFTQERDPSCSANPEIKFSGGDPPEEGFYNTCDVDGLRAFVEAARAAG